VLAVGQLLHAMGCDVDPNHLAMDSDVRDGEHRLPIGRPCSVVDRVREIVEDVRRLAAGRGHDEERVGIVRLGLVVHPRDEQHLTIVRR
jgi:hypothetical protein